MRLPASTALIPALVLALTTSGMALADEIRPITPNEFRDYAEGYTLYFEEDGKPFGSESFEPGGKTTWRYSDGLCVDGAWRPHGAQICFFYGDQQGVLCWRMFREGKEGGLIARLLGEDKSTELELHIARRDKKPLICGGPSTEL